MSRRSRPTMLSAASLTLLLLGKNYVWITVVLRFVGKKLTAEWRERGEQIYRDLRGYLIGASADQN